MCQNCERIKAQRQQVLSHANEIGDLAILATAEIESVTDALKLKLQLDHYGEAGLLDPANMLLLIAHFAQRSKALESDNKRLHETLGYLSTNQGAPVAPAQPAPVADDQQKLLAVEVVRLLEAVANTVENAQTRAMEGINAQIRELKNRHGLNK